MGWGISKRFDDGHRFLPVGLSHKSLFSVGVLLTLFGLLMIYSSSAVMGIQKYGDSLYYVKKQLLFLGLGWLLYFITAQLPIVRMMKGRLCFLAIAFGALVIVLIPGLGFTAGGAQRWVHLGFMQFQPSELARLLLIFYLSATLTLKEDRLSSFNRGFLPLLIVTTFLMFLLILQPDFGGAMSIFILSAALWFIGGVPLAYLAGLFVLTLPAMFLIVWKESYRAKRVLTFLDPWADPQGSGFQIIQSFLAYFKGGWTGVGIGNSQQKLFYLPEAHTDFIFSVVGEELGVVGVVVIVGLFLSLLVMGYRIARSQHSRFGFLLAAGITFMITIPALLNMLVTMGLLPTKGLPLPFFSSGGTSLLISMVALGILQSLHARRHEEPLY